MTSPSLNPSLPALLAPPPHTPLLCEPQPPFDESGNRIISVPSPFGTSGANGSYVVEAMSGPPRIDSSGAMTRNQMLLQQLGAVRPIEQGHGGGGRVREHTRCGRRRASRHYSAPHACTAAS